MQQAASFPFSVPSDILTQEPGPEFFAWALALLSHSGPFCPLTATCWKDRQINQAFHSWVRSVKPSCLQQRWKLKLQKNKTSSVVQDLLHSPGGMGPLSGQQ